MFYVLDDDHNLIEAYDKQGVLAVLEEAIEDGTLENIVADSAFVDKLRCCVGGATHHVAFVPQSKYNELKASGTLLSDCLYYITDDTTAEDIEECLNSLTEQVNALNSGVEAINTNILDMRKKSEARQYIPYTSFSSAYIYDSSTSSSNQPRVDLSNLLLPGKTADDIIGLSGRLNLYYSGGSSAMVQFNYLFDDYNYNSGSITSAYKQGNINALFTAELGIDSLNKLYMNSHSEIKLSSDGTLNGASRIAVYFLNVFYK